MARNGSGTYSLYTPGNPVVTGTTISSTAFNNTMNDVAAALTQSISADGQTPITANIPLNSHKLTGVTAGSTAGDALVYGQTAASVATLELTGSTVPANGAYLPAANTVGIASNTTLRWSVNSTGNHTFAAPSSGVAVALTSVSGQAGLRNLSGASGNWGAYHLGRTSAESIWAVAGASNDIITGSAAGDTVVTTTAGAMLLGTAGTLAVTVAAGRNVTIAAPSSGTALTVSGVAGAARIATWNGSYHEYQLASVAFGYVGDRTGVIGSGSGMAVRSESDLTFSAGGAANKLTLANDGRLYGTALHNNAGSVTGTTNQYIASGTYTPTLTGVTNISGSAANTCQWMRVGNVVTVSGVCGVTTTGSGATELGVSLPIASSLTAVEQLSGSSAQRSTGSEAGVMDCDTTNDRAAMRFTSGSGGSNARGFHFTYLIL